MLALKGLKKAVLAHISDKNNTPLIAKSAVINALGMYGIGLGDFELYAAGARPGARERAQTPPGRAPGAPLCPPWGR